MTTPLMFDDREESAASLRIVIADDEPLSRESVKLHLAQWGPAAVVAECEDGAQAIEAIRTLAPDVVILDIHMPECDGFDVLGRLPRPPAVIFLTAYSEHAVRAFSVRAVDYLLKPLDEHRFFEAMDRARESVLQRPLTSAPSRYLTCLRTRQGRRIQLIPAAEIEWIEAADYYARVHTAAGRSYLVRDSLSYLSLRLDPHAFVRVHRSAIVSIQAVREICPSHGEILLRNGARVSVSRDGRNRLLRLLAERRQG